MANSFSLLYATLLPFVCKLFADTDSQESLIDPVFIISLFQICSKSAVNGLLRVNGFLDTLAADFRKPCFQRFNLGRSNRLDDTENPSIVAAFVRYFFPSLATIEVRVQIVPHLASSSESRERIF